MASTVLPNGIIIPEKFSRDWYADLYHNWQELDNLLGGGTPKDGTLTIQKNGTTVGTFSANQSTNETIDITVPDVNDATLTIQQNGTTVDTFTANSSTDKTVDITVPTKTSDLTNDSGFITEDTTKIPLAGSNAISGDLIPSTDGTVNLGSVSYQWNNAYIKSLTINGVACGDILTHNVSEFVDVSSNQTISGDKTFTTRLTYKATNTIAGDSTSGNFAGSFNFTDKNNVQIGTLGLGVYNNNGYTEQVLNIINPLWFNDGTKTKSFAIRLRVIHETEEVSFTPSKNNTINLGSTTLKWKTLNGLNPGALSLPSGTVSMNLIGDVSVVGTEKKLSKDITVTGYIYVDVSFTSSNRLNLYNDTKKYGIWLPCDSGRIRQIMPISAGDRLEFNVLDDGSTINTIQLFACQGNV